MPDQSNQYLNRIAFRTPVEKQNILKTRETLLKARSIYENILESSFLEKGIAVIPRFPILINDERHYPHFYIPARNTVVYIAESKDEISAETKNKFKAAGYNLVISLLDDITSVTYLSSDKDKILKEIGDVHHFVSCLIDKYFDETNRPSDTYEPRIPLLEIKGKNKQKAERIRKKELARRKTKQLQQEESQARKELEQIYANPVSRIKMWLKYFS